MTEFKAGDVVRIVKRPTATWDPEQTIGLEVTIDDVRVIGNYGMCARFNTGSFIPIDCIELVTAPNADGWQPWNPPSEDNWAASGTRAQNKQANRKRLDAKFGPRPVDEWDT